MGTCVSKCCFASPVPSISDPESPHDKPVISSVSIPLTTAPPPKDPFSDSPKNLSKFQIHPSPPTPSSSSTTPTSSSISTSTTNASNTSTSYSSSYSTTNSSSSSSSYSTSNSSASQANHSDLKRPPLRKKSFSNEFLLSCVENSNIVILDPTKGTKEKTVDVESLISQFSEIPITPSQYLSVTPKGAITSSLRQRTNTNTSMRVDQSIHAKRTRSVSPASRAGRKIIRPDPGSVNPIISRPRTADMQPPQWRRLNSQRGSLNASKGPVSRPVSAIKRDLKGPTMEKEANLAQGGEAKEKQREDGEVVSRERVKTPPGPPLVEDLNNPLIAMDCFIFL